MIISFAWTTPAFLAGRKTCTRRAWKLEYALRFQPGTVHTAYNKLPRAGGKPIGKIRLTAAPELQSTRAMPFDDFEKEGFAYMESIGLTIGPGKHTPRQLWDDWHENPKMLWVVRFEPVEIYSHFKANDLHQN